MYGVTNQDENGNEHIRGTVKVVSVVNTFTKKMLKWCLVWTIDEKGIRTEHILRSMSVPRKEMERNREVHVDRSVPTRSRMCIVITGGDNKQSRQNLKTIDEKILKRCSLYYLTPANAEIHFISVTIVRTGLLALTVLNLN